MTEAEWLGSCPDDLRLCQMLEFVDGKFSERKFYLYGLVCCRQIWHLLTRDCYRAAIEKAEAFVEHQVSRDELDNSLNSAYEAILAARQRKPEKVDPAITTELRAATIVVTAAKIDYTFFSFPTLGSFAIGISSMTLGAAAWASAVADCWQDGDAPNDDWSNALQRADKNTLAAQESAVRDIFGNPFRPTSIQPSLLTAPIVALAQTIYDDRSFQRLPELAAALEREGCENVELLDHLRIPEGHARGCWGLDLILGKR